MKKVFLNGAMVDAAEARVSLFDRGFLYGDGVFETVRIQAGRPFRWDRHFSRLLNGLQLLGIRLPHEGQVLRRQAEELLAANGCSDGVLRITISRGPGPRGLSPTGAQSPTLAMSLHPGPDRDKVGGLRLVTSPFPVLANDPLAAVKSASRLGYVLARRAADAAGADDALIFNHQSEVAETTSSNVFWTKGDAVYTPDRSVGVLPGVAREAVLGLAPKLGFRTHEVAVNREALLAADSVFTTNVIAGVVEVIELDGQSFHRTERTRALRSAFEDLVNAELTGEPARP